MVVILGVDYDHKSLELEPGKEHLLEEEYLHVTEVSPGAIYDFNVGETKFRELLRRVKSNKSIEARITDQYYLYQYVVCYLPDKRHYAYTLEPVEEEYNQSTQRYRRKFKINYFPENGHDLDSYNSYNLIVRIIEFTHAAKSYQIIIPRQSGTSFDLGSNAWLKLCGHNEIEFPVGTSFVVKERI